MNGASQRKLNSSNADGQKKDLSNEDHQPAHGKYFHAGYLLINTSIFLSILLYQPFTPLPGS